VSGGSAVSDGGTVARWEDKSGNGNHLTQSTSGKRPVYDADGFMGLGGVLLRADTAMATAATLALNGSAVSVFAFAQMDFANEANGRLVTFQGAGQSFDFNSPHSGVLIGLDGSATKVISYRGSALSQTPVANGYFGQPNPGMMFRFGAVFDGTNNTVFLNNVAQTPAASSGDFASPGILRLGSGVSDTDNWGGPVKEILVIPRAVTEEERALIDAYLQRDWPRVLVTEGDSVVYGINSRLPTGYVHQALPSFSPVCNLHNVAIGGSRLNTNVGDVVDRTSNVDGQIPTSGKAGKTYLYYIAIGHNDCEALDSGAQRSAWITTLETHCLARLAAGYDHVLVGNILPRTDAGTDHNTNRAALNPLIAAMCSSNGFTLVDLAGHAIMGLDATADNLTYFSDKVHPTTAGYLLLAPILSAAVNSI
jgi:lysophospholipase L1-like esterase